MMAALYLHNAIHTPDIEPKSFDSFHHHRNVSSLSGATFLSTSEFSHPTEPLLQPTSSESVAYLDLLAHQPSHPSEQRPEWAKSLTLDGDPMSSRERRLFREHFIRKRLRRLRMYKVGLEIVMGAFAVYNTVRYFIAYVRYDSPVGRSVSLALGVSTATSFAFFACAFLLALLQNYLLIHRFPLRPLLYIRTILHVLSSFTLLGPAVVNVPLLFVWDNFSVEELNIRHRCHADIDVVWSISRVKCTPPAWGVWITLVFLRLVITIFVIIAYHCVATAYHRVRRPSMSRSHRRRHSQGVSSESYHSSSIPPSVGASSLALPQQNRLHSQHQSSDSTLHSHPRSKHSSSQLAVHSAAQGSSYSDDDSEHLGSHGQAGSSADASTDTTAVEMDNFNDQFRSLVSHVTRETEEGLDLTRSADSPPTPTFNDYTFQRIPPTIGYDEFGRPYPPDEHVPIFNRYVRRMPTIESMGSREAGTLSSSFQTSDRDMSIRSPTASRPSTRQDTLSASEYSYGSLPPSRSNSLGAGAEILLGASRTTEVGELVDRALNDGRPTSSVGTGSTFPSTASYYTATSLGIGSDRGHPDRAHRSPSPTSRKTIE